jgi:hypothetical protein
MLPTARSGDVLLCEALEASHELKVLVMNSIATLFSNAWCYFHCFQTIAVLALSARLQQYTVRIELQVR